MSCLIGKGADVNIKNHYGRTIIHQLALEGNEQMFSLFLSQPGIDLSIPDDTGKSLIHTVCEWGRLPFLKELVNVSLPSFPLSRSPSSFLFPFPFPLPSYPLHPFLLIFFVFSLLSSTFLSSVLYSSISADLFPSHYPGLPPFPSISHRNYNINYYYTIIINIIIITYLRI